MRWNGFEKVLIRIYHAYHTLNRNFGEIILNFGGKIACQSVILYEANTLKKLIVRATIDAWGHLHNQILWNIRPNS